MAAALVLLYLVQTIAAMAKNRTLVDSYVNHSDLDLPRDLVAPYAPNYASIAFMSLLVIGGALFACAWNFAKRAEWVRWTSVVFGVLAIFSGVITIWQASPLWYSILGLAISLVAIAFTSLMFTSDSAEWFTSADSGSDSDSDADSGTSS